MKPDDSSLEQHELIAVEKRARLMLDEADAWQRYPVPIEDILEAAQLELASSSLFDPAAIIAYAKGKIAAAKHKVKSALSKVFGIYDANESIIHIDQTVVASKQNFLKLHETGHHRLPAHRRMFKLFQDCLDTLSPDVADQFEREANNFARFVLFKGPTFGDMASDSELGIRVPINLAKKFGASIYASCREYARTNHRDVLVYVLERPKFSEDLSMSIDIRRIEASPGFASRFGIPMEQHISDQHALWPAVPFGGKKMTRPYAIGFDDLNGSMHECLVEGFDTTYNVILLVYPIAALNSTRILLAG